MSVAISTELVRSVYERLLLDPPSYLSDFKTTGDYSAEPDVTVEGSLRQIVRAVADVLAGLNPGMFTDELSVGAGTAKVVTRGLDTDCGAGWCATGCSHLEWRCDECTSEGGWGAPRETLDRIAAEHLCPIIPAAVSGDETT